MHVKITSEVNASDMNEYSIAIIDAHQQFHFETLLKIDNVFRIGSGFCLGASSEIYYGDEDSLSLFHDHFGSRLYCVPFSDLLFEDSLTQITSAYVIEKEDIPEELESKREMFYRLCDRSGSLGISSKKKDLLFRYLIGYFLHVCKKYTFDFALAFNTPHSFFSYIFYSVLIHKEVEIILLEYHYLPGYSLLFDHRGLPEIPEDFEKNTSIADMEAELSASVLEAWSAKNAYFEAYATRSTKQARGKSNLSGVLLFFRWASKIVTNIGQGLLAPLLKKEVLHFTSLHNIRNNLWYRIVIIGPMTRLLYQNYTYNRLSGSPSLDGYYVLMALHMQPERTSHPLGGEFEDQLKVIRMLADSVPKNWRVLVKEHPNQFNQRKAPNALFRSMDFYNEIAGIENVELVDLAIPSNKLLLHADLVCTLTGTIGWEALQIGKPVLALGQAYFANCRAVRSPKTIEECKVAILELADMDKKSIKMEVARHLLFCDKHGYFVACGNSETKIALSPEPRTKQVESLTKAIIDRLKIN